MLSAALAVPLAACSANGAAAGSGAPRAATENSPRLPAVTPYVVAGDEPAPAVKRAAVRFIETLTNYGDGAGGAAATTARLRAAGQPTEPAKQAGLLLSGSGSGAGQVVYPQLGGLTPTAASVMVVVRQHLLQNRALRTATRTVDVRLSKTSNGWTVTGLASKGGNKPATAAPEPSRQRTPLADQVLTNDRIDLPDSARWDIMAGRVDDRLLRLMLAIAARHEFSVAVVSTGHPLTVFGKRSVSNHIRGRAIDIWKIDGQRVAQQRKSTATPAGEVARQALRAGATEVGAPWTLSAAGLTTFTNTVHQDHLHIAFER